jgi:hypothetical protein
MVALGVEWMYVCAGGRWLRTTYRETNLYAWSKRELQMPSPPVSLADDPLSPEGEMHLYRKSRNRRALQVRANRVMGVGLQRGQVGSYGSCRRPPRSIETQVFMRGRRGHL